MNVINCTPHEINLLTEEANIVYPPSGIVTRVNATLVMMPSPLPMVRTIFGDITGLPEPMDHTYFIVSGMVLSAPMSSPRIPRRPRRFVTRRAG